MKVVAAVALGLALAGCGSGPSDFNGETAEAFVRACHEPAKGQGLPEDVCRCAYQRIADELTFAEFEKLDDDLVEDPEAIPDVVTDAFAACAADPDPDPDEDEDDGATTTSTPSTLG